MFVLLNIVAVLVNFLMKTAGTAQLFMYCYIQGGPERTQDLRSLKNYCKEIREIRESIKLVSALKRRNFVFQQI